MGAIEVLSDITRRILNDSGSGYATTLSFSIPDLDEPVDIKGLAIMISQGFDNDGRMIVSETSHITFAEKDLNDLDVVTRNENGNINISGWKVEFTHQIGEIKGVLGEIYPDPTLGIIRANITIHG